MNGYGLSPLIWFHQVGQGGDPGWQVQPGGKSKKKNRSCQPPKPLRNELYFFITNKFIYIKKKEQKANDILTEKGILFHSKPEDVIELVKDIVNNKIEFKDKELIRGELADEWEDVTELIVNIVKNFRNKVEKN